jgi:RimJ/RimL family protein N-acetyltransferase
VDATPWARAVIPITLSGPSVRLRPVTHEDYGFLWECRCHPDILYLWTAGRTLPSFEQYARELDTMLAGKILTLFLIETRTDPHPVGFIFAYDYNAYDRNVFWSLALHPAYTNVGRGVEASLLFLDYLFAFFDLLKVSSEVYAFNHHSLRVLLRMGAHEEGRFLGHRYYQGAHHDVVRIAATRAEWERARQKLVAILARRPRATGAGRAVGVGRPAALAPVAVAPVAVAPDGHLNGNGNGAH